MKLLLDANLSPSLVRLLSSEGYQTVHVGDIGLLQATDEDIADAASERGLIIVTADSDFPMMLALRRANTPSVIHLRNVNELSPEAHAVLLLANLAAVTADLDHGAIVSLSPTRLAVRSLPIS